MVYIQIMSQNESGEVYFSILFGWKNSDLILSHHVMCM